MLGTDSIDANGDTDAPTTKDGALVLDQTIKTATRRGDSVVDARVIRFG